jgi:hypothetical protein
VARNRATSREWRSYYGRADRLRAGVGDPFRKYVERVKGRERVLLVAAGMFIVAAIAAFGVRALR